MTTERDLVVKAVERYGREFDRFAKLTERVAAICRSDIVESNAIRANVTYRTKSPKRFEGKLERMLKDPKESLTDVDSVFARIGDLSAVRVLTYEEQDRSKVVALIEKRFSGPKHGAVATDLKNKVAPDDARFYRATHCDVYLPTDELVGTYENLQAVPCEIQVCSMLAHVWNEVEHDLVYKPMTGSVSEVERDALRILGHLTIAADHAIKQLYVATTKRQEAVDGPFEDVYDFVARMRARFKGSTKFTDNAGQLFEELLALGLDSPTDIEGYLTDGYEQRARNRIQRLNERLVSEDSSYVVDEQSSDVLLVLLLDDHAKAIVANHPTGRGVGRRPRIGTIAAQFLSLELESGDPVPDEGSP